jgi:hypothetical protein
LLDRSGPRRAFSLVFCASSVIDWRSRAQLADLQFYLQSRE